MPDGLAEYQRRTHKIPRLHWAFIQDGVSNNVDRHHVAALADAVDRAGLRVDVNVVRYNPPTAAVHGWEPPQPAIDSAVQLLRERLRGSVVTLDRVGPDVAASCGQFVRRDGGLPVLP